MSQKLTIFPPQDLTAPCGCKVRFDSDGLVRWTECHLHDAAPELLAACQAARHSLLRLAGNDPTAHDRLNQLDVAIAKALNQKGKLNETH